MQKWNSEAFQRQSVATVSSDGRICRLSPRLQCCCSVSHMRMWHQIFPLLPHRNSSLCAWIWMEWREKAITTSEWYWQSIRMLRFSYCFLLHLAVQYTSMWFAVRNTFKSVWAFGLDDSVWTKMCNELILLSTINHSVFSIALSV